MPQSHVAIGNEPVPPQQSATFLERTEALDTGEISQQHNQSLRTGKEAVIVEEAIALSDTMDLYGSMRLFSEMGAEDPSLNDGSSRLGVRLARRLKNGRTLFGRMEWKINLAENDSQFVISDSTSDGICSCADEGIRGRLHHTPRLPRRAFREHWRTDFR